MQVSHDATQMNYFIKSTWSHDSSLTWNCSRRTLRRSPIPPLLYVHCLDFNSQSYIGSSNLACCRFLTVLGHSFPKELRERQLCLFVNTEKLKDLSNKTSPAGVKVKSSCIHKVSKLQFTPFKGYSLNFCFRFHFIVLERKLCSEN